VILLDTHIWVWWVHENPRLPERHQAYIAAEAANGLAVSAISCWEVAKLVQKGRLTLPLPVRDWLEQALGPSGIQLLPITPAIAAESASLPGDFHRDPSDQIIVATARVHDIPLVTVDGDIRAYPHVRVEPLGS
jgi:PIN domain nuclease of toxin-antitoxin system